jgi:hypothetical protein
MASSLRIAPGLGPPPLQLVTVAMPTAQICRWPLGDPKAQEFHFCGRAKRVPGPYCGYHAAIIAFKKNGFNGGEGMSKPEKLGIPVLDHWSRS